MRIGTKIKPKAPPVEPGTYMATCIGIYDIGEQQTTFGGKTRYVNQLLFTFELAGVTIEVDGKEEPRQLSRAYTASTSTNSGLSKMLSGWLGRRLSAEDMEEIDTDELLGKPCMLTVKLSENGEYSNIDAVMQMMRGISAPKSDTKPLTFDMAEWDDAAFEALPEWVQDKIRNSTQYAAMHAPTETVDIPAQVAPAATGAEDEEVPF